MSTQPHECSDDGKLKPAAQYVCELAVWGQKLEARVAELETENLQLKSILNEANEGRPGAMR